MSSKKRVGHALGHAVAIFAYVVAIATIISKVEALFGKMESFLAPVAFLLLFVVSAAVTGSLIFARPVMLYLDGEKKEAVKFLAYTITFLFLLLGLVFLYLAIKKF